MKFDLKNFCCEHAIENIKIACSFVVVFTINTLKT